MSSFGRVAVRHASWTRRVFVIVIVGIALVARRWCAVSFGSGLLELVVVSVVVSVAVVDVVAPVCAAGNAGNAVAAPPSQ